MATRVLHHPRVVWDLATVLATVAAVPEVDLDLYTWFGARLGTLLGAAYRRELYGSRVRLTGSGRPDARLVEVGLWRARLADALAGQPDLAEDLLILRLDAASRLARRPPAG